MLIGTLLMGTVGILNGLSNLFCCWLGQRTLTIEGSINVWLTSCLTGMYLTIQVKLFLMQDKQISRIHQNNQLVIHTVIHPVKLVFSG